MTEQLSDLVFQTAARTPEAPALTFGGETLSYADLADQVRRVAESYIDLGLARSERIAIYLEKRFESVVAMFAAATAGAVFVPVNPLLRPHQVRHILKDCNVKILVTSVPRLASLKDILADCDDLETVITVDAPEEKLEKVSCVGWVELRGRGTGDVLFHPVIDQDMAAIIYTSGSTGLPKGVVLSHRNMVAGARSVSQYLENTANDHILSVLPLSFDAGLSQLTTAFNVGARVVLMNFLLPKDVVAMAGKEKVTGIAGVPPLWNQLAALDWPAEAAATIRYFTNTGGHMPRPTLDRLRRAMPHASPYLMYGLTEAFRSTYLPPSEVDKRPDSMGKAIPNAEILVVRPNGEVCDPGEPGELVHRGALVALGYWNDPERTAERFRPAPGQDPALPLTELAVWSGDTVRRDEDGYLYFVGRKDEMIKTSGYRVSPTEVEEVVYASGTVSEAVAIGVPHETQGQAIVIVATPRPDAELDEEAVMSACRAQLPPFMVPYRVVMRKSLPRNPNGKIDRNQISVELESLLKERAA
jgi:acyl-CoA ligase (AMP-forming) (exosortase A-associated)